MKKLALITLALALWAPVAGSQELSTLGAVVKTAYEAQADTNAFTDAEKTKLGVYPATCSDNEIVEFTSGAGVCIATPGGGGGAVSSVFTRTGAVVAASGDYTCAEVTGCVTSAITAVPADGVGTSELDDGADTPLSGEYLRVDTVDQAGIEYRTTAEVLTDIGAAASSHVHATADVTSGTFADALVAESNVTQHEAALSVATTQLTGALADARVAESNVTQHQAALTVTESQISDLAHTDSTKLPLAGGTMTGQLVADNLGVELEESDTNPTCAAGNFTLYADLSENKLKACQNGTPSDLLSAGGSGDVVGPASSTDNAIARYDSTTGKLLQNSSALVTDGGGIEAGTDGYAFSITTGISMTRDGSGRLDIENSGSTGISIFSGNGPVNFGNAEASGYRLTLPKVESAVNYISITHATTGNSPTIAAAGSDTDIDVSLVPKGSGVTNVGELLQLTPKATAPATCAIGDIYVDTSGAYCGCSATNTWEIFNATGSCA